MKERIVCCFSHLMSSQTRLPDSQTATRTTLLGYLRLLTTLQISRTILFSNGDQKPPGPCIYFHLLTFFPLPPENVKELKQNKSRQRFRRSKIVMMCNTYCSITLISWLPSSETDPRVIRYTRTPGSFWCTIFAKSDSSSTNYYHQWIFLCRYLSLAVHTLSTFPGLAVKMAMRSTIFDWRFSYDIVCVSSLQFDGRGRFYGRYLYVICMYHELIEICIMTNGLDGSG